MKTKVINLEYYDIVIDCLVTTNNIQHDVWRKHNMSLVNSFLKPDCLAKGQHYWQYGLLPLQCYL